MTARQHVEDATADLTDALTILHRLLPRATTLSRLTDVGDKGCASCRRIPGKDGAKRFYSETEKLPSGGYRTLCHWCRRQATARLEEWRKAHPGQPAPADSSRFWPPTGALVVYRDHGRVVAGEAQWAAWERADRPRKTRKAS